MLLFQTFNGYVSAAKKKISSTIQSIWQSDTVQASYQGLIAPIYSYSSVKHIINLSQDLKTGVSRACTLNGWYALQSLLAYFVYYRMVQPSLQEWRDEHDTGLGGTTARYGISGIDWFLYLSMNVYLISLWLQNSVQNAALTSSITYTGSKAMPPSKDFVPCECSNVSIARADGDSLFFYMGNRYVITKLSQYIENSVPGYRGKALAFGLEAVSFGWPLVEYKFSAVGRCTSHRYQEMLSTYKTYCVMYGASFVAATWSTYRILSAISGEKNLYIYDAVFSFMFQMYALLAIAREQKLPGNDVVTFDIMPYVKYIVETPIVTFFLEKFLGDLYSVEKLVQSPGVSLLLSVRDTEIKDGINSIRGGIQQIKDIQSSRTMATLKWIGHWLPYQVIPDEIKAVSKSFSKTAISRLIRKVEYLLSIARDAEVQRNVQQSQLLIETREDHFGITPTTHEFKTNLLNIESKPMAFVENKQITPPREYIKLEEAPLHFEHKREVKEDKAVVRLPPIKINTCEQQLGNLIVNGSYFKENKSPELAKTFSITPSQNNSMLFSKKDNSRLTKNDKNPIRKQDPLASMTASIISNTARTKVLR